MRPLQKGSFCPQRCSQMLIYYFINSALLLSLRTKMSVFCTRSQFMQTLRQLVVLKIIPPILLVLLTICPAQAEDEAALVNFQMMRPELAMQLAQYTLDSCRAQGYQIAVAVVDRSGVLQALVRDRFAGAHTPNTAQRKAWTAASFKTDTLTMAQAGAAGGDIFGANYISNALLLGGGVPIEAQGSLIGGIGVSGAPSGEIDDECARAGIDEIQADLEF